VLTPGEPFLFRRGDDPAVDEQRDGGIVKDGIDTEDSHPEKRFPKGIKGETPLAAPRATVPASGQAGISA
jgi:hypothetical protein